MLLLAVIGLRLGLIGERRWRVLGLLGGLGSGRAGAIGLQLAVRRLWGALISG